LQPANTLILLSGIQVFAGGSLGIMRGWMQSLAPLALLLLLLQKRQSWWRVLWRWPQFRKRVGGILLSSTSVQSLFVLPSCTTTIHRGEVAWGLHRNL